MNICLVVEDSRLARVELVQLLTSVGAFEDFRGKRCPRS